MAKENSTIIIIIMVIIGGYILFNYPELFETKAIVEPLFKDQVDTDRVRLAKTAYIEDEIPELVAVRTGDGIYESSQAVWINGKRLRCSEFIQYVGATPNQYLVCNQKTISGKTLNTNWNFDFGEPELPEGFQTGDNQIIEGWVALAFGGTDPLAIVPTYFRLKVNVAPKPCLLQPNQLIAAELFSPGIQVSDTKVRYEPKQWCSMHPPKVYNKNLRIFEDRYDLFYRLKNGETLTVPSGESWIVFYVIDVVPEIPVMCDPTMYYDVEKEICTDVSGIMTVCSYGTFDPMKGLCVVQADEIEPFCELGRYDTALGQCLYNPPLYPLCDFCEDLGCELNYVTDRCEYDAPLIGVCPEGSVKVGENCEFDLPTTGICPEGTNKVGDICEFDLPTIGVCPVGSEVNGICQYDLPTEGICSIGTEIDGVCKYSLPEIGICPIGMELVDDHCEFMLPAEGVCPVGTTQVGSHCEFNLPYEGVCPIGMNKVGDHCEFTLPSEGICPTGTTKVGNHCEFTLIVSPCPSDYLFENGKCVRYPEETISCPEGFVYESNKDACIKYVPTEFQCIEGGVYENGVCIVKVTNPICPKGVLSDDKSTCIISPDYTTGDCIQGTWSSEKNACVITPNLDYLCIIGEKTLLDDGSYVCTIYPMVVYKCQPGFVYEPELEKCVAYPEGAIKCPKNYNYNEDTEMCEFKPGLFKECPENTKLDEERDVCVYNPKIGIVCPEGSTYSAEEDKCIKKPGIVSTTEEIEEKITLPSFKENIIIYIILGIIVVGVGYLIFSKKK